MLDVPLTKDHCGMPSCDRIWRYILYNTTTGLNYNAFPNRNTA